MTTKTTMVCRSLRYYGCILLFLAFSVKGHGQSIYDYEIRQELGVIWQPYKKFQLNPHYRLNTFDNSSRFKRSMFGMGAEYSLRKWLSVGGEYRYYISYTKDYHRFAGYLKFSRSFGKLSLRDRLQYQQDQDYFDERYLSYYPPQRVFRNKVVLNYSYTRKLAFYAYAEPFVEMKHDELKWYRVRYGLGGDYLYKRQHEVGAEVFLNNDFQTVNAQNTLTLKLSYTFHLTKAKKKKKKAKDSDTKLN